MAVIAFSENSADAAWVVAGWAFRQILADVMMFHRQAVGYLRIGRLDEPLATRLTAAIKETAVGVLAGERRSGVVERFHDEEATQEYLKGLRMLLDAARSGEGRPD